METLKQNTKGSRQVKILAEYYNDGYMSSYIDQPTECVTPRLNPKVNYGFWMIVMYQCRFILGKKKKKSIILMSNVDNGKAMCLGTGTHTKPPFNFSFPGGSVSKESACNAGDPGLIPE